MSLLDHQATNNALLARGVKRWGQGISAGSVPFYYKINKFGANPTLGTTTEDIWDGAALAGAETMTLQTAEVTVGVSSSDAKDDAAGVGARTMTIYGIDGNWVYQNELVTLDGQTKVETTKKYLFIYRAIVRSAGTELDNAGTIYMYNTASGITAGVPDTATQLMAAVSPGENQTLMAHFPVGAGFTGYIDDLYGDYLSTAGKYLAIELYVKPFGEVFQEKHKMGGPGPVNKYWDRPNVITEKSIIKVRGSCSASAIVDAGFDIVLQDNNLTTPRQTI